PRQGLAIPIPAPFVRVAVHVEDAPGVRRIPTDRDGMTERWALLRRVVRAPGKVRLIARQRAPERGRRRGPGSRRVLPLGLRGQPELPVDGKLAGIVRSLRERSSVGLGFGEVD